MHYFCTRNAQMAELVDALVSNTSGFTSMPVRSRLWVQKTLVEAILRGFLLFKTSILVTFGHHNPFNFSITVFFFLAYCLRQSETLLKIIQFSLDSYLGA